MSDPAPPPSSPVPPLRDEPAAPPPGEPAAPPPGEPAAPPPDEPDRGPRMSFMDHLLELRSRLIVVVFVVLATTVLAMVFYEPLFAFLRAPVTVVNEKFRTDEDFRGMMVKLHLDPDRDDVVQPITTNPLAMMIILMKVALYAGLVLASPVILYELWAFVSPGLRPNEVRAIRPVLICGVLFFLAGAAFCYYLVFPFTIEFLVWLDVQLGYRPSYTPEDYIGLLLTFMLLFGVSFEMPLVSGIFAKLGILKPSWLTHYWRAIVLACFILGAFLSPGTDVMSMLLMSFALLGLYLASVVAAWALYPKPAAKEPPAG